jgi:hypothetical protein
MLVATDLAVWPIFVNGSFIGGYSFSLFTSLLDRNKFSLLYYITKIFISVPLQ